jgi:hypothetical protein
MIGRLWHAWTTSDRADHFERMLREDIAPDIARRQIPGYYGLDLFRRDDKGRVEFATITWFSSLDAVIQFAGPDFEKAVVHGPAEELLDEYDQRSTHYQVRSVLPAADERGERPMFEVLVAAGPAPEREDHLGLFGQFVGSWDFEWIGHNGDGSTDTANGEWHFDWVLEGRAVQDVWIVPGLTGRRPGTSIGEYGSTIRAYNPAIDAWNVVWVGAINGTLRTFVARQVGDEIVMECTNTPQGVSRWTFDQVTLNSFHWRSEAADSPEGPWRLKEEMRVRRRGEDRATR